MKLTIAVCLKQTVDKDINPFDACALEEALRIKAARGEGETEVIAVCMGPKSAEDMLKKVSRLGADRCVLLTDPVLAGSDTLATAYALSLVMKKLSPALILCGRQSIDGDTAQIGPELATALGYSLITNIMKLSASDEALDCETRFGHESAAFPALGTVERINTLRFPRLGSKMKEVEILTAADIDADVTRCGLKGSPTKVLKTFESSLGKRKCKYIDLSEIWDIAEGEAEKERIEVTSSGSSVKLPLVWCVGEKPVEKARSIADEIKIIDESMSPFDIADLARAEKPSVILWSGDFLGRRNAPQTAYLLETGLCADCTSLETDGEKLFMYRPAFSGSIMAKIECKTLPQMATVRTSDKAGDKILLCAGLGAAPYVEKLMALAKERGYAFGATRALVDKLALPYEYQIGLTGRTVCPKVYIALGVSGAVQHTCAIEQSGTIISVNCDKAARIFDYSDYGVVGDLSQLTVNS